MDIKLRNSKPLKAFKILCFLFVLIFSFISGTEAIISARANILYRTKDGKPYETLAFLQNFKNDSDNLYSLLSTYNSLGIYESFGDYAENSPQAQSLKDEYAKKEEEAIYLFNTIAVLKTRCPGNIEAYSDADYDIYAEENGYDDVEGTTYVTTMANGVAEPSENEYKIKESYRTFTEWAYDYARLRRAIFSIVKDATSADAISSELYNALQAQIHISYSNYVDSTYYNEQYFESLKNFKYVLTDDNGIFMTNIATPGFNEYEFINSLEKNSMFYVKFEDGVLLSPAATYDRTSNILNFVFNSGIADCEEITEETLSNKFGEKIRLYVKISAEPTDGDSYKMLYDNFQYSRDKKDTYHTYLMLIFALLALVSLAAYALLTGTKTDVPVKLNPFEKLPLFLHLGIYILFIVLIAFCLSFTSFADIFTSEYTSNGLNYIFTPKVINILSGALVSLASFGTLIFVLYIARNRRAETLERRFIIGLIIIGLQKLSKRNEYLRESLRHLRFRSMCLIAGFFIIDFLLFIASFLCESFFGMVNVILFVVFVIYNICAFIYAVKYVSDCLRLSAFSEDIRKGNYDLNINVNSFVKPLRKFAVDLSACRDSVKASVDEAIKGERMKTELITNVSHDLKTPLTSIINYVSLLKLDNISEEDKKSYLDILEKKSKKLQRLIEDLTEASKATSGNMKVTLERVNLNELALQAVGENSDALESVGLDLVFNEIDTGLFVRCNTQHTFRVIDNLFSNAKKYSLEGSRVYADVYREGNYGVFSLKNVSRDKLNVAPDELTERFVRGDKSRTTEGSGLGLSIARSFTEIQGGIFNLEIDGDLFKAVIKLPLDIDLSKGAEQSNEESAAQTAEMPEFRTSAQPE